MSDDLQHYANMLEDALKRLQPEATFSWRKMFGGAGYYANDVIFAGYMGDDSIVLKLEEDDRAELLKVDGAKSGMFNDYVLLPSRYLTDTDTLDEWVRKSLAYVATLPKKKKKSKKK